MREMERLRKENEKLKKEKQDRKARKARRAHEEAAAAMREQELGAAVVHRQHGPGEQDMADVEDAELGQEFRGR